MANEINPGKPKKKVDSSELAFKQATINTDKELGKLREGNFKNAMQGGQVSATKVGVDRFITYGSKTFSKLGFDPNRDNAEFYNNRTSTSDEIENPNKNSLIDEIDTCYKKEKQQDLRHLIKIEKNYLSNNNKAKLEVSIQQLDKLYYSKYNPLDKFTSIKEYTLYSVSLLLIASSILMIVKLAIKRMLKIAKDLNVKREELSNDKSIYLNINSEYLKKGVYSLILAFLICNYLQLSKLNFFKHQFYKHFFYVNYYSFEQSEEMKNISFDLNANSFFGNEFQIPENLYKVKSSWKGIYIEDFYDYKFKVIELMLKNTLIDYLYWILISSIIMFLYFIYKKYLKRLKINIS